MVYSSYDSETQQKQKKQNNKDMKILKFSIIAALLLFMTSCDKFQYVPGDKGVVIEVEKVENINRVTIKINASKTSDVDTYMTFLTNKQYNIDDVVYFTK